MADLSYRAKIELGITASCLVIGGFFSVLAMQIPPDPEEIIDSRTVPLFVALMIMGLGVLISVLALANNANGANGELADGEIPLEDDFGFLDSDIMRVFEVIGCGIVYIALFWAFGYFVATMVCLGLMLLAFGKPPRATNCDCERSNEPSLLQTMFLRNDTEMLAMLERKIERASDGS